MSTVAELYSKFLVVFSVAGSMNAVTESRSTITLLVS